MNLRLREHRFEFAPGARPLIMGIVNLGLDSVADASVPRGPQERIERGLQLAAEGAQIIDLGAQSGRTDNSALPAEEEIALLVPVVRGLADAGVAVSVDTFRAEVARAVVDAGAALINDVSGLADPEMVAVAAESGAGLVVMHTRTAPKTAHFPDYVDAMADVCGFLGEKLAAARAQGVTDDQLIIDPGLDYAKRPAESIDVLRRWAELDVFGRPALLAVSRKHFVGMITASTPTERLAGTLAAVEFGVSRGAQIVRVHDVKETTDYLTVRASLHGHGQTELAGDPDDDALKWIAVKSAPQA